MRATITQIEKYNTAANTFRGKYGFLPGDIKDPEATNFGFVTRGQYAGEGDGNGLMEGIFSDSAIGHFGNQFTSGEIPLFWVDLSKAHMIEANFSVATSSTVPGSAITAATTPGIKDYMPETRIGRGDFIYVFSGGLGTGLPGNPGDSINYFTLSSVTEIFNNDPIKSGLGLTAAEAYSIDRKIDDGFPQTGNATAIWNNDFLPGWVGASDTSATAASATTCYDNGNSAGAQQQYSVKYKGSSLNCALSFRFQ